MLLRYFVNFYDMEIIEEEAFLAWKEDITQEFPGKGKALFQVMRTTILLLQETVAPFHRKTPFTWFVFLFLLFRWTSGSPGWRPQKRKSLKRKLTKEPAKALMYSPVSSLLFSFTISSFICINRRAAVFCSVKPTYYVTLLFDLIV